MLTLRMAMSDLHDRLEAAWALHTGTAPVSLCGAIVARLTPLLDLAAETHSCDALLRSPGCVDDMLTAMELVVKCYQDMDCATFADEQHLAEQAQALLLQFSAELEQYGSSLE